MKTIRLDEIFSSAEVKEIQKFIKSRQFDDLRKWLNEESRKKKLEEKEILADYLYYYLLNLFQ